METLINWSNPHEVFILVGSVVLLGLGLYDWLFGKPRNGDTPTN